MIAYPDKVKSQLFDYIHGLAAESVYGCGSSELDSTVRINSVTDEIILGNVATISSDQGVCCFDEYYGMTDNERIAVEQVMKQPTIAFAEVSYCFRFILIEECVPIN